MKVQQESTAEVSGIWRSRWGRFLRIGLLVAALPVVVFLLEDWRGRRAWEQCKRELAAIGEAVEWSAFVPQRIPDDANVLKAPSMANWFGGPGNWFGGQTDNELVSRFNRVPFEAYVNRRHSNVVFEVSIVPSIGQADLAAADLVLHHDCRVLSLAATNEPTVKALSPQFPILPLIQFQDVALSTAIENLTRQEGVNYLLDPKVMAAWQGPDGVPREPLITFRWQNLTIRQALYGLLNTYGLLWIEDPQTGIGRITLMEPSTASVHVVPEARARLLELTRRAILQRLDAVPGPRLDGSQGYTFVAGQLPGARPMRVIVLAEYQPDTNTVADFFPRSLGPGFGGAGYGWRAESTASNSFRVYPKREPAYAADEYLDWSDRFQPEFGQIRAALQRPSVYLEDDYEKAGTMPMRNHSGLRYCSQILAQRAQCHLLLGRPDNAVQELTLIHELRRLLSGKPVTLVAAMMDVAVAGLYVGTIADGLRLRAWREPDLVTLQQQLGGINLLPAVQASFRTERAMVCQKLQVIEPDEFAELYDFVDVINNVNIPQPSWWKTHTDTAFLLLSFAPRGWLFQNVAVIARVKQFTIDVINPEQQLVEPTKASVAAREVERLGQRQGPYTVLARRAESNFVRAVSTLARNQTSANQALIACGLERYRRAHGGFPESPDALVPQFLGELPHDIIGGQPLRYQRTDDGNFLPYSIGWNEMDEGGKIEYLEDETVNYNSPDWVWESSAR